jgi:glutamate carboxypeptidase
VVALGVLRALAGRPETFGEVALLLVNDEEWRIGPMKHAPDFADFDACLCFEAGQAGPDGASEAVVVKRKAAGTLRVRAAGRSAHSGSAPDRGRNALLALAVAAQFVAAQHDPAGSADHLSAVPTIMNAGEAFNVVPPSGELYCDLRADSADAFQRAIDAVPPEVGGATLAAELIRVWPGMDARAETGDVLARAGELLGRPVVGADRGGASDASHMAQHVPLTIDGLGPRGGLAHNPEEWVSRDSLRSRAEVALAVALSALGAAPPAADQ